MGALIVVAIIGGVLAWASVAADRRRRSVGAAVPAPRRAAPPRPTSAEAVRRPAPRAIPAPPRPLVIRSVERGVEITVNDDGITVKYWRARAGGPGRWATYQDLSWTRVATLAFDSDWRDPAVSLYATGWGDTHRVHVVDSRKISEHSWSRLAERIAAFTEGRLVLDLSRRRDPGPARFD